ncbi:MAG TPA: hypothetical protein VFF06_10600 [Polyangia bacterium]|nr:hypothetical protein [Polyangia bacterium]
MRPLALGALLLTACHAALDAGATPDLSTTDLRAPPIAVNLLGDWSFTADAQPTTDPTTLVISNTADWIDVSFSGAGGCGCSARHLVVTLPAQPLCDTTVMTFDWTTNAADFTSTQSTALRVLFNPHGTNYGNQGQFFGSTWVGQSSCAIDTNNAFPSPAQIAVGHNRIALGQLVPGLDGRCTHGGNFTSLDIHMQGYTCGGNVEATLAYLAFE